MTQKNGKQFTITMQNPTFGKIQRDIKTFNENLYEMWNIVIDPITVLPSQKDDFYMFVQSLPKNHRYFFTTQIHPNSIDDYSNIESRNETLRDYRDSFLLPDNSISVFNTYKNDNDILAYNYNTNESYNLNKKRYAEIFCKENKLEYKIIDPKRISNDVIRELYELGYLKFIDRYEKKYQEKFLNFS